MSRSNDSADRRQERADLLATTLGQMRAAAAAEADALRMRGEAIANRIIEEARLEAAAMLDRARAEVRHRSGLKSRLDSASPDRIGRVAGAPSDEVVRAARTAAATIEDQARAIAQRTISEAEARALILTTEAENRAAEDDETAELRAELEQLRTRHHQEQRQLQELQAEIRRLRVQRDELLAEVESAASGARDPSPTGETSDRSSAAMMTQESEILRDARRTAEQILANAIRAASQLRSDVAAVADPEPEVIDLRDHVNPEPQG